MRVEFLSEQGVRENEDTFIVDEKSGLFAVFDGASSLVPFAGQTNKTGARIAAETARDIFTSTTGSLLERCMVTNTAIDQIHLSHHIDTSDPVNRFACTVAAVQIRNDSVDLVQCGDTLIIVEDKGGTVTVPLRYDDADQPIMQKWRCLANQNCTNIRERVDEDVIALRRDANKTYGVLNGDPSVRNFLKIDKISRSAVASILILSDGSFIPKEDPATEENWAEHVQLCKEVGLKGLLQKVRDMEKSDPCSIRYPRYKLHDDATGIFIQLAE